MVARLPLCRNLLIGILFSILPFLSLPLFAQDATATDTFECLTDKDAFVRHIEQGAFYRGRRDYQRAYQEYNCAITLDPFSVLGYRGRAVALVEQGNYQAALADLQIALDLTPNDAYLYNSRGWAYYGLGDTETALDNLNKAIALDPNYAIAFNNRGLVERSRGELEAALRDFQIAIDLGYPDRRFVPYINMGDTYAQDIGDLHSAARWYDEAARISPGQGFIHEKLGDAYLELGMWREATTNYEQFIYLNNLDRPQVLNQVRLLALREFVLHYLPTFLIAAILLYFALPPLFRRWRRQRHPQA
jgi:tetratricopeptide (TPR) repeat protein